MNEAKVIYRIVASPIGPLLLAGDGTLLAGLYMESHRRGPRPGAGWQRDERAFAPAVKQLAAYFAGELTHFNVPLSPVGTDFQRSVWAALGAIEFGQTLSYAALARKIGAATAVRAVGAAVGCNPVSIIVPCHRVIGSDGQLTGYAGGLDRKRWLLGHERTVHAGSSHVEMPLAESASA